MWMQTEERKQGRAGNEASGYPETFSKGLGTWQEGWGIDVSLDSTTSSVRLDHFSLQGGLAVGIPGELRGMELAHHMFGR